MTRATKIGAVVGVAGTLLGFTIAAASLWSFFRPAPPRESLVLRLDVAGPYVILATDRSTKTYARAIEKALTLHSRAARVDFDPQDLDGVLVRLRQLQPRYALVFIQPDELDVNFAWRWLTMTSQIDDDPFVDVRTGFITGATPEAAEAFVERIALAAGGQVRIPGACVDNLGPAEQAAEKSFNTFAGAMMLPSALSERFTPRSISHGKSAFDDARLTALDGAGLIHFGGHGHRDRIDDGIKSAQLPGLKLAPCVVFNGACYTGVTRRWYDESTGMVAEKNVDPADSFCLALLKKDVFGYLAALHPDHGMPVYQEMEFLACEGASLGDVMKHTYDGIVLGAGGKLPTFEPLNAGRASSFTTPADIMLKGTAARIMLGDPALVVCDGFLRRSFSIKTTEEEGHLRVTATVANPDLKSTFTDTYFNDLAPQQAPFNDRALLIAELPEGWDSVSGVEVGNVSSRGKTVPHRLVGYALERDGNHRRLHIQIDVAAQGFQQSALRVAGAAVEFVVKR
jgi:hypothetical protein